MNTGTSCSDKTKVKMALTLKKLMQNAPFEKITVSDITNACGTHRQTFYYHFQDRYELLDWLLYNELLHPFIDDFSLDNMIGKFYNLFETMYQDKKFYQNALKINSDDFSKYISKVATEDFTKLIHRLAIEHGVSVEDKESSLITAEFIGYGISGVIQSWAHKGMKETPKMMTERIAFIIESSKKFIQFDN